MVPFLGWLFGDPKVSLRKYDDAVRLADMRRRTIDLAHWIIKAQQMDFERATKQIAITREKLAIAERALAEYRERYRREYEAGT